MERVLRVWMFAAVLSATSATQPHQQRIIGGAYTKIANHPYQISLQKYGTHICGGAIIAAKVVVTSAHCLYDSSTPVQEQLLTARAGSTYREREGVVRVSQSYEYHPGYDLTLRDNDFAVVKLKLPFPFGETIQPIALVPENQEPSHGEMLTVTGWGKTEYSVTAPLPMRLQELRVANLDRYYCRLTYGKTNITYNMLCAGGSFNKRPYHGDSGGPLVNEKKQLVGLVSFRQIESTNPNGYPTVYANLASPRIRRFLKKETGL